MIIVKSLFIFFIILISLAHCKVAKGDSNDDDDSHVIVVVNTAAMKIARTVVGIITDFGIGAINALSSYAVKIEEILHDIEQGLVDLLWKVIAEKLDEMQDGANDVSKTVIQCAKEQGDDLKEVIFNFLSQLVTCKSQNLIMTSNTYVPILVDIKDTNDKMKDFIDQLDSCGNDETAIPCIDEVEDEIKKELIELLSTVVYDLVEASKFQENIDKFVSSCQRDTSTNLIDKFQEIISAIAGCVKQYYINSV